MRNRLGSLASTSVLVLAVFALLLAFATPASAQVDWPCTGSPSECANQPPVVVFAPTGGTVTGTAPVYEQTLTIYWCHNSELLKGSSQIRLNDAAPFPPETFEWTEEGASGSCAYLYRSDGKVVLTPGTNVVYASISTTTGMLLTGWGAAEFTYERTGSPSTEPTDSATYGVVVRAVGDTALASQGREGTSAFVVENTGNRTATFTLARTCTSVGTCASAGSVTIEAFGTASVPVRYTGTTVLGTTGQVTLSATHATEPGVTSQATQATRVVALRQPGLVNDVTTLTAFDRGQCLMLPAGRGVYECGDLRLAYGMPGVRALGKTYAPTLVYLSQHAAPQPVVATNVTPASGKTVSGVTLTLQVDGGATYTKSFAGWSGSDTRRMAVTFDATSLATGVYPITLSRTVTYTDATTSTTSEQGVLPIVNRIESPFGRGWWMAGVEQLFPQGDGTLRWVGGDGSTNRYHPRTTGPVQVVYVAEAVSRPDTLYLQLTPAGDRYQRALPGGGAVTFNEAGHHISTTNALGLETRFVWGTDWTTGLTILDSIHLPKGPSFDTGESFALSYGGTAGTLARVVSPAGDTVWVHADASARIDSIRDPLRQVTRLEYGGGNGLVTRMRDRASGATRWSYDTQRRLASSSDTLPGKRITSSFIAQEGRGTTTAELLGHALTHFDGPLASPTVDVSHFQVGRWGAPHWLRNPLQQITQVWREDPRWPVLATRTRDHVGRASSATYDHAGRLLTTTDSARVAGGVAATTTYTWDAKWNAPTRVVSPTGLVSSSGYDPATGNLVWSQAGTDTLRRVRYGYHPTSSAHAPGLLAWVRSPEGRRDSVAYDARGNVSETVSPTGVRSLVTNDGRGRPWVTRTPINAAQTLFQRDSVEYDRLGRVRNTWSFGPAHFDTAGRHLPQGIGVNTNDPVPAQTLRVTNTYDAEGRLTAVSRWSEPDTARIDTVTTQYVYDWMGRRTAEIAPDGVADSTFYDDASRVVRTRTRRGHQTHVEYDLLGRPTRRISDSVYYAPHSQLALNHSSFSAHPRRTWHFPYRGTDASGNATVPNTSGSVGILLRGDTTTYEYHADGNLKRAANRDAIVRRTYHPDGSLRTDTLVIKSYGTRDTTSHVYGLTYRYDLEGRRTEMDSPSQLAGLGPWVQWGYDGQTGALATVQAPSGPVHAYTYRRDGQVNTYTTPSGVTESHEYDGEGRLQSRMLAGAGFLFAADTLTYDVRGKTVRVGSRESVVENAYAGLGTLLRSTTWPRGAGTSQEQHVQDALGNTERVRRVNDVNALNPGTWLLRGYEPGTGRLRGAALVDGTGNHNASEVDTTSFDAAGNAVFAFSQRLAYAGRYAPKPTWYQSMTASYYDAEGRLRVVDRRTCAWVTHPDTSVTCEAANDGEVAAFEEMRYDPLGRRIVVKTDQGWACASNCVNGITRTVWDGDRVLWEIRATNAALQQDTGAVSDTVSSRGLYGRVGYVFGAALDHPLELRRYEHGDTLFVTHATSGQTSGLSIDPVIVFPHANWRGDYTVGTYEGGRTSLCVKYLSNPVDQTPVGEDPGLTEPLPDDSSRYCFAGVQWPAAHLWLDHGLRDARPKATPGFWAGSLIHNKRDLSGNLYMRNRYYDPSSGRFTQEDPIGIAGGLNTYGFANGDPASYSDPYGLCPDWIDRLFNCAALLAALNGQVKDINNPPPPAEADEVPGRESSATRSTNSRQSMQEMENNRRPTTRNDPVPAQRRRTSQPAQSRSQVRSRPQNTTTRPGTTLRVGVRGIGVLNIIGALLGASEAAEAQEEYGIHPLDYQKLRMLGVPPEMIRQVYYEAIGMT